MFYDGDDKIEIELTLNIDDEISKSDWVVFDFLSSDNSYDELSP